MSARLVAQKAPAEMAPEYPELRAAYAAERVALQRIADMKARKVALGHQITRQRRDQEHSAARMARGEAVTGADIRNGAEAIAESEAELGVLEAALPRAAQAAYEAASDRDTAEAPIHEATYRPYRVAVTAAEQALKAAQAAYDKAKSEVADLPPEAQAALDETLDEHGRDRSAPGVIAEMRRIQQVNESRRLTGQGPMLAWP